MAVRFFAVAAKFYAPIGYSDSDAGDAGPVTFSLPPKAPHANRSSADPASASQSSPHLTAPNTTGNQNNLYYYCYATNTHTTQCSIYPY